mgnify:FL=1
MATADTTRKLLDDLTASYNGLIGAQPDLTTWLARKLAQSRATEATTTAVLYDGDDILDEVRTYVNALADNTTP